MTYKREQLSRREIRIRDKFAGGKTIYEVGTLVKGKPGERQLRRIVSKLTKMGELEDLDSSLRGQGARHRFIPTGDSFGAIRPHLDFKIGQRCEYKRALNLIFEGAWDAVHAIRASSRSQTPKRSRDVCNRSIKPVLNDIYRFGGYFKAGRMIDPFHDVPLPGEFFTAPAYDSYWTRRARLKEREGTIRVRHPKSHSEQDYFFPTLEDWERYFNGLILQLQDLHVAMLIEQGKNQD